MTKQIKRIRALYIAFFTVLTLIGLSAISCTSTIDPNNTMVRFSVKGGEKKEVTLYGQMYVFEIIDIVDSRCISNPNGYGLAGVKTNLSIRLNQTSISKNIELYSNVFCGKRDLKDTLAFFDKISDVEKTQEVEGFKIRLFDASPYQTGTPFKVFPLSDYELTFITKKQ